MKIAFNPSTVAALTSPPNNKDITFDLRGRNIFARGVKFQGTDTNTWRGIQVNGTSIGTNILNIVGVTTSTKDGITSIITRDTWRQIKINNVSIGTNVLDLRNGSNTTLSHKDGVVTINANLNWDSITGTKPFYTKAESDTRYLQYNGIWKDTSEHDLNDASGMIFAYRQHTNSPLPNWGIVTTFNYALNSNYRFQLASNGYTNALYYRNRSVERKGWTSWVKVLDTGNSSVSGNTITINGTSTTWQNTWRTVSVNGVSIGMAPLNFKAGSGISLSESNGTITVTSTSSAPNILLYQYLASYDTNWYPLIWGGDSHMNTNNSTGRVYKSYDKLSWQTSSQTLYATRLETTYINLQNNRGISQVTSGGTSPYKGIKLPDLQSSGIGIFSKLGDGNNADEGGIIISADTSVIYNSFDTGWGLTVRDKDKGQMDISGNNTIAFGIRSDYRAYSLGGFEKSGSSNSYVLLGGGDHKLESALNVANADTLDGYHATSGNNKPWGTIPVITAAGYMDIGKHLEFHYDNTTGSDYSTALMCQGNYSNIVYLPSASGTLALTSQVLTWKSQIIDMRNYSGSYWHPVTVPLPYTGYNKIKVSVQLNIYDKPSWATHSSGFTCNMEIWATASGWGTTSAETICLYYTYAFCSQNPCGWSQLTFSSQGVLFLRGGSRYRVYTDFDATFTPHDKTYTWTSGSYSENTGGPYTSCPGLNFNKNKIYANLDGYASRLEGGSIPGWGTLTAANGFTNVSSFDYGSRGAYGLCGKNDALYMQLDGWFYQNEGKYRVIDTSEYNWTSLPGKIVAGNEFNIVSAGYSENLAINYLPINNRNSSANIGTYTMYNGNRGLASVYAKRFKVDGTGCAWMHARNYAPFYSTFNGGWEPILDIKTVSGDWAIGSYDSFGNHLVFAYESDSDYNNGANGTAQYWLSPGGEFKINTLRLTGSTNANMGVGSTNPQIIFTENGAQQVALTYTDWDVYRPSKGLKVHSYDGSDDSNVWFEVQGYNYSSGYVKNGSSDAYVLLGGGGHKPLSQFSTNTANSADTIKIWEHESNDAWYYVTWTTQSGTGYGSIYESTASLQYNPSQKTLWTGGGLWASNYVKAASIRLENTNEINSYSGDLFLNHRNSAAGSEGHTANIRMCGTGGSVIIGANDTPSYQLDVRGSVIASSWLRTRGATGWYSESYGGGIWMSDSSWIRTYGSKPFYCDKQIYSSDSIRMASIYLHYTNEINNADNGKLHLNYRNTGNVTICNGGGAVTIGSTTDDIGNNKLYVKGSEFIDGASNVRNHVFADGFRHRSHNSNDAILLAGGSYMVCKTGSTSYSKAIQIGNFVWIHISIQKSVDSVNIVPSNISNPTSTVWLMSTQNGNYNYSRSGRFYILTNGTLKHVDGNLGECIYETVCYYV